MSVIVSSKLLELRRKLDESKQTSKARTFATTEATSVQALGKYRREILETIKGSHVTLISAPTGCGKVRTLEMKCASFHCLLMITDNTSSSVHSR